MLRSDFFANATVGLRDSRKIVVTFFLLRLHALSCYDLHRLTPLLSFANVTFVLLLHIIGSMTCVFRCYNWTSSLVILSEDSFDQSCFSADLPAAAASPCVATVHYHAIAAVLLSNNVGIRL